MPFIFSHNCPICREWMDVDKDEIAAFPSFIGRGKFSIFDDTVMHRRCFVTHPLSRELRSTLKELTDPSSPFYQQQLALLAYIDELLADDNDSKEQRNEPNDDDAPE